MQRSSQNQHTSDNSSNWNQIAQSRLASLDTRHPLTTRLEPAHHQASSATSVRWTTQSESALYSSLDARASLTQYSRCFPRRNS